MADSSRIVCACVCVAHSVGGWGGGGAAAAGAAAAEREGAKCFAGGALGNMSIFPNSGQIRMQQKYCAYSFYDTV